MNKKILLSILLLMLGVAIIIVTAILEQNGNNSFRAGMFTGFGSGLVGIAVIYMIKLIQYKKSPDKLKKDEIISKEERTIMIKDKASSVSVVTYNLTLSAIIMILAAINTKMEIILIVAGSMMLNIIIFFGMLYYYGKKY